MLVALVQIGRRAELRVPFGHLGPWLRDGDPGTVVVALLRWVALLGAAWLLASTLLYLAAAVSRAPAAVRAVSWSTLPAARRAIDAACRGVGGDLGGARARRPRVPPAPDTVTATPPR